jgi:hypothetical protein
MFFFGVIDLGCVVGAGVLAQGGAEEVAQPQEQGLQVQRRRGR